MLFKKPVAPKVASQKKLYLVDYENTNSNGLHGIDTLDASNHVIIMYGNTQTSIPLEYHQLLMKSKATIEEMRMEKTGKNYLDFQLSTYVGYLIGTGEYKEIVIVSGDTGYDSIVSFWQHRNVKISRKVSIVVEAPKAVAPPKIEPPKVVEKKAEPVVTLQPIYSSPEVPAQVVVAPKPKKKAQTKQKTVPESTKKKVRKAIASFKLSGGHYNVIYNAMATEKDKNAYHNAMMQAFKDRGTEIYNATVSIFVEYVKNQK